LSRARSPLSVRRVARRHRCARACVRVRVRLGFPDFRIRCSLGALFPRNGRQECRRLPLSLACDGGAARRRPRVLPGQEGPGQEGPGQGLAEVAAEMGGRNRAAQRAGQRAGQ
jgi:hypothetical protein